MKQSEECNTKLNFCFSTENTSVVLNKIFELAIPKDEEMGNMGQKLTDLRKKFEDKNWQTDKYYSLPIWLKK